MNERGLTTMTEYIIKATKGDTIRYFNCAPLPVGLAELREHNWHITGVRKVDITRKMLNRMGWVSTPMEEQFVLRDWYKMGKEIEIDENDMEVSA